MKLSVYIHYFTQHHMLQFSLDPNLTIYQLVNQATTARVRKGLHFIRQDKLVKEISCIIHALRSDLHEKQGRCTSSSTKRHFTCTSDPFFCLFLKISEKFPSFPCSYVFQFYISFNLEQQLGFPLEEKGREKMQSYFLFGKLSIHMKCGTPARTSVVFSKFVITNQHSTK